MEGATGEESAKIATASNCGGSRHHFLWIATAPSIITARSDSGNLETTGRAKRSRDWRRILIELVFVGLLASVIVAPLAVSWADQRTQMHVDWVNQGRAAAAFNKATQYLADLLSSPNWPNNGTSTIAPSIMFLASTSMHDLKYLDWNHATQLSIIEQTLDRLGTVWSSYVMNLTPSERIAFSEDIRNLGGRIVAAYTNYYQYTLVYDGTGPPFWYNGPSPPDEAQLQQAVTLANLPGLPPLSYG